MHTFRTLSHTWASYLGDGLEHGYHRRNPFFLNGFHAGTSSAGQFTSPLVSISENQRTLRVFGKILGEVTDMCSSRENYVLKEDRIATGEPERQEFGEETIWASQIWYREALALVQTLEQYFPSTGEGTRSSAIAMHPPSTIDLDDAFWCTLICNSDESYRAAPTSYRRLHQAYHEWMITPEERASPEAEAFGNLHSRWINGRYLCTTRQGSMGWAPSRTNIGDLFCVLEGADVPIVIRRSGERYEWIGSGYLHGYMYGEAYENDRVPLKQIVFI